MIPTLYKGSDRWYYTAVLSNPKTGDVAEQQARFYDQRTVPLIEDTAGYCAALNKLTIRGAAANLPILVPPIQRATLPSDPPLMYTDYMLGVRYLAFDPASGDYAVSDMQVAQLRIPSTYPQDNRADTSGASKFYWVSSQADVATAINTSLQDAFTVDVNRRPTFYNVVGGVCTTSGTPVGTPFAAWTPGTTAAGYTAPFSCSLAACYNYGTVTDLKKMVLMAANGQFPSDVGVSMLAGPHPNFRAGTHFRAYVYFNDKLLEACPWDTLYDSFADPVSTSYPMPWLEQVPNAFFNSSDTELIGPAPPPPLPKYSVPGIPTALTGFMYPLALTQFHGESANATAISTWVQENAAVSNWTFYTGLAVASGVLPGFPVALGVNSTDVALNAQTNTNAILFEADLPIVPEGGLYSLQNGLDFRPENLQWQRLKPGVRLSSMDLSLYLRTRKGDYVPWMVTNGGAITIQLVISTDPW